MTIDRPLFKSVNFSFPVLLSAHWQRSVHNGGHNADSGPRYSKAKEDDSDSGVLSPSPSSSLSSVDLAMLGDEIIDTTTTKGDKSSPLPVTTDKGNVQMAKAAGETQISHYPKRKRASVYENLGEDKLGVGLAAADKDASAATRQVKQGWPTPPLTKGVLLGYWKDSPVPSDVKKHAVIGFLDVRNRLRTRIQPFTRGGETIDGRLFPIPLDPGGSWTMLHRIVFEDHLVGLDHNEIKEYIKIRLKALASVELEGDKCQAELDVVKEAKRNLQNNPDAESPTPPAIMNGEIVPNNYEHDSRLKSKSRWLGGAIVSPVVPLQTSSPALRPDGQIPPPSLVHLVPTAQADAERTSPAQPVHKSQTPVQHQPPLQSSQSPTPVQTLVSGPFPSWQQSHGLPHQLSLQPQQSFPNQPSVPRCPPSPYRLDDTHSVGNLPGQRPTRILVGCWPGSSAEMDQDKHAVYGILGADDRFRVKLVRETMDGRFVDRNFPIDAGALWIRYEEVNFLPHICDLDRAEMKEYVRVRQHQIDSGEAREERVANEAEAVYEAHRRAALNPEASSRLSVHAGQHSVNIFSGDLRGKQGTSVEEQSGSWRGMLQGMRDRPVSGTDYCQSGGAASINPLERINSLARREVRKLEAAQMRRDRFLGERGLSNVRSHILPPAIVPSDSRAMMLENMVSRKGAIKNQGTIGHHGQQKQTRQAQQQQQQHQADAAQAQSPAHAQAQVQAQPQGQTMQMILQPQPPQLPSQPTAPIPNIEEVKILGSVIYSRKHTGLFDGKLVSCGEIVTIDGEDYVEYRVLTKPTFF